MNHIWWSIFLWCNSQLPCIFEINISFFQGHTRESDQRHHPATAWRPCSAAGVVRSEFGDNICDISYARSSSSLKLIVMIYNCYLFQVPLPQSAQWHHPVSALQPHSAASAVSSSSPIVIHNNIDCLVVWDASLSIDPIIDRCGFSFIVAFSGTSPRTISMAPSRRSSKTSCCSPLCTLRTSSSSLMKILLSVAVFETIA